MSKYIIVHLPDGWLLARTNHYKHPWAKNLFVLKTTGNLIIGGAFHNLFAPSYSSFWREAIVVDKTDVYEFENDDAAILAFEVMT